MDGVGGGSFKGLGSSEAIVVAPKEESSTKILPSPSDQITPDTIELGGLAKEPTPTKPVEITKPNVLSQPIPPVEVPQPIATVEVPTPAQIPTPATTVQVPTPAATVEVTPTPTRIEIPQPAATIEVPAPAAKIEVPAPASSFKPGGTFKPRKRTITPTDTSWNNIEANTYQHGADEDFNRPVAADTISHEVPAAPQPLPKPHRLASRPVLQANQVERNNSPASKTSQATVPALNASFKSVNSKHNWLREQEHVMTDLPKVPSEKVYEVAQPTRIAAMPTAAAATPNYQRLRKTEVEQQPVPEAIVLKAIPLKRAISSGNQIQMQVQRQLPPENVVEVETVERAPVFVEPTILPAPPQIVVQEQVTNRVEIAAPPQPEMVQPEHTARAISDGEFVTPPWRIK